MQRRQRFGNAEEYAEHLHECFANGWKPWWPETADEFRAAYRINPEWTRQFIPRPRDLKLLGLPEWFGKEPQPFDEKWCEEFICTLEQNPLFLKALKGVLSE